jgi:pyruvate dehydrogenase (quinone)
LIDDPRQADAIMERAFKTPGPVIIECLTDPNEPPMPPDVESKQAEGLAKALARGEPNGFHIATTIFRDKFTDLLSPPAGRRTGFLEAVKEKARNVLGLDQEEAEQ